MKYALIISFIVAIISVWGQQGNGGRPKSYKLDELPKLDAVTFARPNMDVLRSEDEVTDQTGNGPWRFGFNNYTSLNLSNSGTWFEMTDGSRL